VDHGYARSMSDAAVILAAGGGSRFNANDPTSRPGAKLVAQLAGRTVFEWAIAPALAIDVDEVVVVGGALDLRDVVPAGVTLVQNDNWTHGLATSLHVGLDWCQRQGHGRAIIGLGDTVGLTAQSWRAVRSAPGGPIVFAVYDGRRGHPVRLDAAVWSLLATHGDEGARGLARARPELVCEVACDGSPHDVDVPEDLERLR
jgi:molybdenum cofactor cytidylyltransferase